MKRFVVTAVFGALAMSLMLVLGCSEKTTQPVEKVVGDTLSQQFQLVEGLFQGANMYDQIQVFGSLGLYGQITNPPTTAPQPGSRLALMVVPGVVPVYHESSQYWYYGASSADTSLVAGTDSIDNILISTIDDSLQFLQGTMPVQYPDSLLLTAIRFGARLSLTRSSTADTIIATQRGVLSGEAGAIAQHGIVQINGNGTFHGRTANLGTQSDSLGVCGGTLNLVSVWSGVTVDLSSQQEDPCPIAGSILHMGNLNVDCVGGPISVQFGGYWTMLAVYSADQVAVTFESPSTRWSLTRTCGDMAPRSPFANIHALFNAPK